MLTEIEKIHLKFRNGHPLTVLDIATLFDFFEQINQEKRKLHKEFAEITILKADLQYRIERLNPLLLKSLGVNKTLEHLLQSHRRDYNSLVKCIFALKAVSSSTSLEVAKGASINALTSIPVLYGEP